MAIDDLLCLFTARIKSKEIWWGKWVYGRKIILDFWNSFSREDMIDLVPHIVQNKTWKYLKVC